MGSSSSGSSHSSTRTSLTNRSKTYGYTGTLSGITRGVNGTKLGTDCHYDTPVGGFTVSKDGWRDCDDTHPAPKGIGSRR